MSGKVTSLTRKPARHTFWGQRELTNIPVVSGPNPSIAPSLQSSPPQSGLPREGTQRARGNSQPNSEEDATGHAVATARWGQRPL